jgi:hypothetical protein
MLNIQTKAYAPDFLKKAVAALNTESGRAADDFEAVLMATRYPQIHVATYPSLRDRTDDWRRALVGFGRNGTVHSARLTGSELMGRFGFNAVGAQLATSFDVLWID